MSNIVFILTGRTLYSFCDMDVLTLRVKKPSLWMGPLINTIFYSYHTLFSSHKVFFA